MSSIFAMLDKSTGDFLSEGTELIEPDASSRYGLNVPRIIYSHGNMKKHARNIPKIIPRILRSALNRNIGYKSLKKNPIQPAKTADKSFINELKTLAHDLG